MLRFFRPSLLAVAAVTSLVAMACSEGNQNGLPTLLESTSTSTAEALTAAGTDGPSGMPSSASESTAPATTAPASTDTASTDPEQDGTDEAVSDEERLLEFAACMRDNGVEFPDPIVEADGTISFGLRPGAGGASRSAENLQRIGRDRDLPAAREACGGLLEGLAFGRGSQDFAEAQAEQADRLLEFAQCLRDNGIDVGDPDTSGFGPGGGGGAALPFGDVDFDDPDASAALDICAEQVSIAPRQRGRQSQAGQ